MNFKTKHIGVYGGKPANIIELTVESANTTIIEDITNLNSKVDVDLITTLREIADELEEHNNNLT